MAKRKKLASLTVIKFGIVGLIAVALGVFICQRTIHFFKKSEYFSIQAVIIDSSLSFINKSELSNLKGKNIFGIDLEKIRRHLSFKYPQVSDLRIVRKFPNQIHITAKPRFPFAQIQSKDKILTLDENGIVLSSSNQQDSKLIYINSRDRDGRYTLGLPYSGNEYRIALEIGRRFTQNRALSSYEIDNIDIQNLSKVDVKLSNGLDVIFDSSNIGQKVKILGIIMAQGKVDFKEAKYIDLRFKEPIVGKK